MKQKEITLIEYGDGFEMEYFPIVKDSFPNYEIFWRNYIFTFRKKDSIQIWEDVVELTIIFRYSYSIFLNLMKANYFLDRLKDINFSYWNRFFNDFIIS